MKNLFFILIFVSSVNAFTKAKDSGTHSNDKMLMGIIELPMDTNEREALDIAKFIKTTIKPNEVIVRQISGERYGIAIKTMYPGGNAALEKYINNLKDLVTKKFGKKSIASWNMAGKVNIID